MTSHSEIDITGFRRAALLKFLADGGINLAGETVADTIPTAQAKQIPDWANACRAIRRFTLDEAASILVGADPHDSTWFGDEWQREYDRARIALSQAIDDGEIVVAETDTNGRKILSATHLRVWASAAGYEWPIPEIQPSPGPAPALSGSASVASDDILKRLQDSERERHELQAEVERLKAEATQITEQGAALAEQAAQIGKLQTEIAQGKAEIERLQTEIAKGKSLPTLQKLVIAMAIDGYGYKPEDSKSPIPKQIEGITGGLEIEVTDETVLRHLRLAATTHLPVR